MSSPYITRLLRYRFLPREVAVSEVGGWLGSPVLGDRLRNIQSVYLVPAILGAIASVDLSVLCWKASAEFLGTGGVVRSPTRKTTEHDVEIAAKMLATEH